MIAPIHEPLTPGLLMTPTETADLLRISPRHLSRLTAPHGDLPCLRLGPRLVRYERGVVEQWILAQRTELRQGGVSADAEDQDVADLSGLRMTNAGSMAGG